MSDPPPGNTLNANDIRATNVVAGVQHIVNHYHASGGRERDEARLTTQITNYLKWLAELTGRIELRGIERAGGARVVQLPLATAYVPLEAQVTLDGGEKNLKARLGKLLKRLRSDTDALDEMRSETVELPLNRVLELGNRLVITGGPGSGKTTVLLHMAWALATSILYGTDEARTWLGLEDELPLPIFVPLASFARYLRGLPTNVPARDKTLASFISYHLISKQAGIDLPDDFFAQLVSAGRDVMLLLDGLDEVANEDERAYVREQVESLVAGREILRTIVTCRTIAYKTQGTALVAFKEIAVKFLNFEDHVVKMVEAAYVCIFPEDVAQRTERAGDLLRGIQQLEADRRNTLGQDAEPLVATPLMVRLLLIVHYNERKLPDQRAELFDKATNALVQVDYARDEEVRQALALDWRPHRDMAQQLAFYMHQQGRDQGRELDEPVLRRVLKADEDFRPHLEGFLLQTRNRGGLLEEREGSYRFIHLAFQEFLVARHIREVIGGEGVAAMVSFFDDARLTDPWWREPILLTAGYLGAAAAKPARDFLRRLSEAGLSVEARLNALELAGTAALEWRESGESLQQEIAARIADFFADAALMDQAAPAIRARAGNVLARLGDPRFDADMFYLPKEPLLGFILIPASSYLIGTRRQDFEPLMRQLEIEREDWKNWEDEINDIRAGVGPFLIARYPVTVAQWRAYVNARRADPDFQLGDERSLQGVESHPVICVTWHESMAYCAWLTRQLKQWPGVGQIDGWLGPNWSATLPSELEWEKAARGDRTGSIFPWGAIFDNNKANANGIIGKTTAVGCFLNGASTNGCQDLIGNVWEWTRCRFNYYPYVANDGREDAKTPDVLTRVRRGGSWIFDPQVARCAYRSFISPVDADIDQGFRVVLSPVSSSLPLVSVHSGGEDS